MRREMAIWVYKLIQHHNRRIEKRGEGHPRRIGHEQQRADAVGGPTRPDKNENDDEQRHDDGERDRRPMQQEEGGRPGEIQRHLGEP